MASALRRLSRSRRLSKSTSSDSPSEDPPLEDPQGRGIVSGGYDCIWAAPVDKRYECPICLLIQRDPLQTHCGHRYCKSCISKWLSENSVCPACNSDLTLAQMFSDIIAQREILMLKIHCTNQGCSEVIDLGALEHHLELCELGLVPCPNQCTSILRRRSLTDHLHHLCPNRTQACPHCHLDITVDIYEVDGHNATCLKMAVPCKFARHGCAVQVERGQLENHLITDVHTHLQLLSDYVSLLESHLWHRPSLSAARSLPLPARISDMKKVPEQQSFDSLNSVPCGHAFPGHSMDSYLPISSQSLPTLISKNHQERPFKKCRKYNSPLQVSKDSSTESDSPEDKLNHRDTVAEYVQVMAQMEEIIQKQNARILQCEKALHESEGRHCNGIFYWKIRNYRQYRDSSSRHGQLAPALHSPGFYSSFYGYKMCVRLNPIGVEQAFRKHVSVFLHFMAGENDDILKWPFKGSITISILDQSVGNLHHISDVLHSKSDLAAFQKPTSSRNHKGFGYLEFAPIEVIENGRYIKDNTLIIKVVIQCTDNTPIM